MDYNFVGGITFNSNQINMYLDSLINKVFAILGIYEECEKNKNFENYIIYLNRLLVEIRGFNKFTNTDNFLSIISTLKGLTLLDDLKHGTVKSLTFHCISIIKKAKVK